MYKNILPLLILAASSFVFSQTIDPYDYFPSSVGNRWEYSVKVGRISVLSIYDLIEDTVDNKIIYITSNYSDQETQYVKEPRWMIDTSYNVFLYPSRQSWNYHYYKLDADSGDSWWVKRPDSTTNGEKAFVTKIYKGYVLGKITTIKRIEYYLMAWYDSNQTGWLNTIHEIALGIGKIYEWADAVQPDFLIGAIIDGDTLGTITSVESEMTNNLLTDIILHQNYPNPFNSTTNINYYLLNSESIKISIYDVLGREVAELYKGWQQSGYHEIQFNTKNLSSSLASGIYFYTITTSNQSISKKMILLR